MYVDIYLLWGVSVAVRTLGAVDHHHSSLARLLHLPQQGLGGGEVACAVGLNHNSLHGRLQKCSQLLQNNIIINER